MHGQDVASQQASTDLLHSEQPGSHSHTAANVPQSFSCSSAPALAQQMQSLGSVQNSAKRQPAQQESSRPAAPAEVACFLKRQAAVSGAAAAGNAQQSC